MEGFQDAVSRGLSAAEQEVFEAYNLLREAEREEANLVEESGPNPHMQSPKPT